MHAGNGCLDPVHRQGQVHTESVLKVCTLSLATAAFTLMESCAGTRGLEQGSGETGVRTEVVAGN